MIDSVICEESSSIAESSFQIRKIHWNRPHIQRPNTELPHSKPPIKITTDQNSSQTAVSDPQTLNHPQIPKALSFSSERLLASSRCGQRLNPFGLNCFLKQSDEKSNANRSMLSCLSKPIKAQSSNKYLVTSESNKSSITLSTLSTLPTDRTTTKVIFDLNSKFYGV